MFGLFKPPRYHIKKRIPMNGMLHFTAVEVFADMELGDLPEVQREFAVAFVLSVWACNTAMAGGFQLSQFDYRAIQNAGMNAVRALPKNLQNRAEAVVDALIEKGTIPTGREA